MLKFILRRLGISFLVLMAGSVLMFVLTIHSDDPLKDLRESNAPNRENLIAQRARNMRLDDPWYERYWDWLTGVSGCVVGKCDFGTNREGVQVSTMLTNAASATLRLVVLATILAIITGITLGILTAVRQYSGFDYVVTFLAFVFFSLPVFWAAVLLKQYASIEFNNWLKDPQMGMTTIAIIAAVFALALQGILGGDLKRRALTALTAFVIVAATLWYFDKVSWITRPQLGAPFIILAAIGVGALVVGLTTGFGNKQVRNSVAIAAALGIIAYLVIAFSGLLDHVGTLAIIGMAVAAILIGLLIGYLMGGFSRKTAMWTSALTLFTVYFLILVDKVFYTWGSYVQKRPRPIPTIGAETPNFAGTYWESVIDKGVHIILPTIVLTLISVAGYTRYTRASMLEVLNQDYIRTARSKGLSERKVITKHAFRNSLIPLTTIVAFDFAALIGGAVITESVFGWKGMGELFRTGLNNVDPAPVMAFFLVTGTAAVTMNMVADIMYAVLDPRIRR